MGRAASLRPFRPRAPHEPVKKMEREREREGEREPRSEFLSLYRGFCIERDWWMILSRERKVGNFILVPRLV